MSGCLFIRLNNEFVFPDSELPIINTLCEWSGIYSQLGLCSFMSYFIKPSKLIIFYGFVILLHLIFSFSLTRSLLVAYACGSMESIDCILLSSFELNAILLISLLKTLCLSLLNLCSVLILIYCFLRIFYDF